MDYKTQLKKRLSATSDTTASDSESDFMRGLSDRVAKAQNPYLNVDNEYIESFGKKYEKYATDTQNTKMNYDNAVTKYKGNVVTGNGLKDVANAIKSAGEPLHIEPDLDLMVKGFAERGVTVE